MTTTWILVADRSRARILAASENNSRKLEEIADFVYPESGLKYQQVVTDRQGHFEAKGVGLHAGEPETDFKHQTANRFAVQLCEHLEKARLENRFARLHVVAAPLFLGVLREKFPTPLTQLITREIAKDYTLLKPDEIQRLLADQL